MCTCFECGARAADLSMSLAGYRDRHIPSPTTDPLTHESPPPSPLTRPPTQSLATHLQTFLPPIPCTRLGGGCHVSHFFHLSSFITDCASTPGGGVALGCHVSQKCLRKGGGGTNSFWLPHAHLLRMRHPAARGMGAWCFLPPGHLPLHMKWVFPYLGSGVPSCYDNGDMGVSKNGTTVGACVLRARMTYFDVRY